MKWSTWAIAAVVGLVLFVVGWRKGWWYLASLPASVQDLLSGSDMTLRRRDALQTGRLKVIRGRTTSIRSTALGSGNARPLGRMTFASAPLGSAGDGVATD
jgi:hypothetical protein